MAAYNYKPLTIIDVEDFITRVKAKPGLWDQNDSNYFKRDYIRAAWTEVSDETGVPVHELKKRWRGLRDTFLRELCKAESSSHEGGSGGGGPGSTWRHFPLMLFLRDFVSSSKRTCTRDRVNKCNKAKLKSVTRQDGFTGIDEDDSDATTSYRSSSPASEMQDPISVAMAVKVEADGAQDSQGAVAWHAHAQEVAVAQASTADADGDAQFLQSLLPFLRDVPRKRKLRVRTRLTQVLLDEQDAQD